MLRSDPIGIVYNKKGESKMDIETVACIATIIAAIIALIGLLKRRKPSQKKFHVKLIAVEYYKGGPNSKTGCTARDDYILIRQIFEVEGGVDPKLTFVQSETKDEKFSYKDVSTDGKDENGLYVHSYCATPDHYAYRRVKFLRYDYKNSIISESNVVDVNIDVSKANIILNAPPRLFPIN